jgi:microcystin degradation protein MlrC
LYERGRKAAQLMLRILKKKVKPVMRIRRKEPTNTRILLRITNILPKDSSEVAYE